MLSLLDGDNVASGAATVYTYDARNLKTSEAFPGHGPTSNIGDANYDLVGFSYDAAGRILVKTDQQGDLCTFNYDLAGRLTSRDYVGGSLSPLVGQSDSDLFVYDAAGRMTSATSGRYNNSVALSYDAASRLVGESLTAFAQTYTVGSGFDAANRKTSITYPDGSVVDRVYTDRNQLSQIKYAGAIIDTRTYDSGGRLTTSLYGNGIGTTWSYRADNLPSSISTPGVTSFTYAYDTNKNKTAETIGGTMSGYGFTTGATGYDSENRLTNWNRDDSGLDQSWSLSLMGDWTSFTQNTVAQNRTHGPTHELTAINSNPLIYDAKGNLLANSNAQTYTWDFNNRMSAVTVPAGAPGIEGAHSYGYDTEGRRVSKSVDNGAGGVTTTVFVIDKSQVIAEYLAGQPASNPERKFVYASYVDEPCLFADATGATEALYYYHRNNLYSLAALTDSQGAVAERYAYDAYGKKVILDAAGSQLAVSAIGNPFAFTGRRFDEESGLQYSRARYYSPDNGRFLSRDPMGFIDSPNLYLYVYSQPLMATDPSGFSASSNTENIVDCFLSGFQSSINSATTYPADLKGGGYGQYPCRDMIFDNIKDVGFAGYVAKIPGEIIFAALGPLPKGLAGKLLLEAIKKAVAYATTGEGVTEDDIYAVLLDALGGVTGGKETAVLKELAKKILDASKGKCQTITKTSKPGPTASKHGGGQTTTCQFIVCYENDANASGGVSWSVSGSCTYKCIPWAREKCCCGTSRSMVFSLNGEGWHAGGGCTYDKENMIFTIN